MAQDDFQVIMGVVLRVSLEKGEFRRLSVMDEDALLEYVVELNQKVFDRRIKLMQDNGVIP